MRVDNTDLSATEEEVNVDLVLTKTKCTYFHVMHGHAHMYI